MTINKNANRKLIEKISTLFLALVLTACSVTPVSAPSPSVPPATEAIPTPTEIAIELEGEVFSTTENLPKEIIPSMELFTEMAGIDGLDINELHPILWLKAAQGEFSVDYALLQIATITDLTDPDGEPGNPKPFYYIAYQDEQGQMQGGYVLGKLIEKDSQGVSYVARMLSEETFSNWQNNTQPEDGSYTVGQVVYSVPLREDISVEQARTMQAKLNSGELSSEDFMENYAEGVAFIQPGQEKQVVGIDKNKSTPELIAKPFWQELFSGVTEAQAAGLEFSSEPEPTPTAEPTEITLTPEQQLTEYLQTYEAKESIDQFVNAMQMAGIEVTEEQVAQGINFQELKDKNGKLFIVAVYNLNPDPKKTDETLEGPIPLLIAKQGGNGEWGWKNCGMKDLANIQGISMGTVFGSKEEMDIGDQNGIIKNNFDDAAIPFAYEDQNAQRDTQYRISRAKADGMSRILFMSEFSENIDGNPGTLGEVLKTTEERIRLLKKFEPDISVLRVLNEVHKDQQSYKFWQKFGDSYITEIYRLARRYFPNAQLLYNETYNYDLEDGFYPETKKIVELLKAEGLIDVVGMEMHMYQYGSNVKPNKDSIIQIMQSFGLPVYITELDVNQTNLSGTPEQKLVKQAETYNVVVHACVESKVCKTINLWGMVDKYSWLEYDWLFNETGGSINADPNLFDDSGKPKISYYYFLSSLLNGVVNQ
jgi:hypothetical protein